MLRAGTVLGGRYEIVSRIGSGGMSDVYKATDKKLNRFVAIKVLKSEFSTEQNFVGKFRMEAQSAARLTHPNIVSVFDVGEDRGVYYIVMELIDGITLKKYIERKKKLEIRESIEVAMQVARGIEAAHAQHIIHRDIKPQNIMISRDGKVKVTDFGIARASSSQTISSNTMGSVHYISPEQARGGYCDERSDIYSLGITLYEMLTGRVPYEGDSTVSVALLHIQGEMVPPRQYEPLIPVSLEKIILKCTQKKAELRYSSATELISDLKKSLTMPNGDFVKITSLMSDSPTVIFSEDEKEEISKARSAMDEDGHESDFAYREQEDYDYDDRGYDSRDYDSRDYDSRDYNSRDYDSRDYDDRGRDYDDRDYRDYDDRDYDQREYRNSRYDYDDYDDMNSGKSSGMEKMITGISIAIAVLIVGIVATVALKGCGGAPALLTTAAEESTTASGTTAAMQVKMKNLLGLNQDDAIRVLESQGLKYSIKTGTSDEVGEGEVYEQEYKEGEMLDVGTVVTLKVSSGAQSAQIPEDLSGMTVSKATKKLVDAGFKVSGSTDSEYSNDVAEGKVVGTDPSMGTVVKHGSTITLVLSQGPETKQIKVPDITGITEAKAIAKLEDAGLKAGSITTQKNDKVAEGLVISQSLNKGDVVDEGTAVSFVVSEGASSAEVPNLLYLTLSEAKSQLLAAGLEVGSVTEEYSDESTNGLVISQSIKKGTSVDKGTAIDISIGKGAEPTKAPETEAPTKPKETEAPETKAPEPETEPETYVDAGDPDEE